MSLICQQYSMSLYSDVISSLKREAEKRGGKGALLKFLEAPRAPFYRTLADENSTAPNSSTLFDWLEKLGYKIIPPSENPELSREVCFVNAKISPAVNSHAPPVVPEDYLAVPLVDEVGAGPGIIPQEEFKSWFLVWRWQPSLRGQSDFIAVEVAKGSTSMIPTLKPGDIALVLRTDIQVAAPGKMYLVLDPDGAGMIKRVMVKQSQKEKDFTLTFYSDNAAENPPEIYSLKRDYGGDWSRAIVGRVVWAWSDVSGK